MGQFTRGYIPCILWIFMGDKKRWKNRWFQSESSEDSTVARRGSAFLLLGKWPGLRVYPMWPDTAIFIRLLQKNIPFISHSYPIHIPFISHYRNIPWISRDRSTPPNHHRNHPPKIASSKLAASRRFLASCSSSMVERSTFGSWFLAALCWDPLVNNCYIMVMIMVI